MVAVSEKPVTPINMLVMSGPQIIRSLHHHIIGEIPNGIKSESDLQQIEYFLGKAASDYAYVIELLNYARMYTRRLKRDSHKDKYEDMMDIKNALEELSGVIKLKYQAISRMLTIHQERADEQEMRPYRLEKE